MSVDTFLIQAPQVNHCRIFADVSDFNCQGWITKVFQPWQSKSGWCSWSHCKTLSIGVENPVELWAHKEIQCCRVSLRAASTELQCCKEIKNIFYSGRFNDFPATYVFADCADDGWWMTDRDDVTMQCCSTVTSSRFIIHRPSRNTYILVCLFWPQVMSCPSVVDNALKLQRLVHHWRIPLLHLRCTDSQLQFVRHSFLPPSCKLEGRNLCFIRSLHTLQKCP